MLTDEQRRVWARAYLGCDSEGVPTCQEIITEQDLILAMEAEAQHGASSDFKLRETVGGCVERLEHDRLAREAVAPETPRGLSDPRGQQADAASWLAEKATRQGRLDEAREQYARAAAIEQAIAFDSADAPIRVRSVLAVSAAALWFKAGRWTELQIFVHGLLAEPDLLTSDAQTELRALLLRSWNETNS